MRKKYKIEKSDGTSARFPLRAGAERVWQRAPLKEGEWIKLMRWSIRKGEWVVIHERSHRRQSVLSQKHAQSSVNIKTAEPVE